MPSVAVQTLVFIDLLRIKYGSVLIRPEYAVVTLTTIDLLCHNSLLSVLRIVLESPLRTNSLHTRVRQLDCVLACLQFVLCVLVRITEEFLF